MGLPHFGQQQIDDLLRRSVAEKLAKGLFVPGDAVPLDQSDEVMRRIAAERRNAEMRVGREELRGCGGRLVKLQRPPPEMRIFSPGFFAWSTTRTLRPRLPAMAAHIMPAAPAPITMTSHLFIIAVHQATC